MIQAKKSKNIGTFRIGGEEFDVYIAKSEKAKARGFQGFNSVPEDEGMLFVNSEPEDVWYHMQNVGTDLDLLFMDEDMKVISKKRGKANDPTPIKESGVMFVLEIAPNDKINVGDEGDLDEPESNYVMKILAPDGSTQFQLKGGERIYSRKSTKSFIRKAIKAERSKEDKDYKALGKAIFKELYAQDHREPEYVNSPK
jgi:uncharacterized membrane protein (UPF0127 family)